MKNIRTWLVAIAAGGLLAISTAFVAAQDVQSEQLARLQYRAGMQFLAGNKVLEALKDFEKVVELYPQSSVAGAALLQIAQCQFSAGEIDKAQAAVERLQKSYPTSESASMGLVLSGRIVLAKNRTAADVESAINSYRRVSIMYAGSDAVPASMYFTGEALRISHQDEEAIESYRQVSTAYPESEWAPRAMLGEAQCLVLSGRATRAMDVLQRVRQRFPNTPEATKAVAWNTILNRLYLRAPNQPAFQFVAAKSIPPAAGRLKDVKTMAIGPTGSIYAATADTVWVLDMAGKQVPGPAAREVRSIMFDRAGQPVLICKEAVASQEINNKPLGVKKPDGTYRYLNDVASGVVTSSGDLLVADSSPRNIGRFSSAGPFVGQFTSAFSERLAIDVTDRIASVDPDGGGVSIYDHDARPRPKILPKGPDYQFQRPVDIAFDQLGHVYVLDRNAATVWIFAQSPQPKLLTGFNIAQKSPGVFRKAECFALDLAGRLYIYDEDVQKIQVYQ